MKLNTQLTIGIDARFLAKRRGIGNYIKNLLEELAKTTSPHKFILYADSKAVINAVPADPRFSLKIIPFKLYPIWEQLILPFHVWADKLDILHCPGNSAPIVLPKKTKLIITIHDVMYMLPGRMLPSSPSLYQKIGRLYLRLIVPLVAKNANKIITISKYSESDIVKSLSINESRLSVIYEAPGAVFRQDNIQSKAKLKKFNLNLEHFLFAFGALDPRKNTARIINAFAEFQKGNPSKHQLVVVGLSKNAIDHFSKQVQSLKLCEKVALLGFVSEDELISLYSLAEVMLYPSLYEGFGIPVLEAMACGTPVIGSTSASIPEIAGNAALLVDPLDVNELTLAITKMCADNLLRQEYRTRGLKRVTEFSWQKVAQETLSVYNSLCV
ncbi:MAG: glycosyltransferase family 1 protein [Mucilaginibacter sp.]